MFSTNWINKVLVILILVCSTNLLHAASFTDSTYASKKKIMSFEKSVFVGSDFNKHVLIGFSGPQLMFSLNDHTKFGPCYYPSLWWNYTTGDIDTKLGVGARLDYKHSILGFSTLKVGNNKWIGTLILGVRF